MEVNRIYNESCLDTLARMPDAFLDCVVTSPPYYGLRSYGTEPQVWGDSDCSHVWGEQIKNPKADPRSAELKKSQGATIGGTIHFNCETANGNSGNFCQLCNAWRGELGLEPTFQLYISHLIDIFQEVKRALKPSGTVWVNLGDSYGNYKDAKSTGQTLALGTGSETAHVMAINPTRNGKLLKASGVPNKSLMNIPSRFAIAMTDELQMIQRNKINWWKRACMPSSAKDRFTVDFEDIYFFTKSPKYYFEQQLESIKPESLARYSAGYKTFGTAQFNGSPTDNRQPKTIGAETLGQPTSRNMRTTWDIPFEPSGDEHYAAYPTKLVERMIRAGCPEGGLVYDPFGGTATTAVTAHKLGRNWICSELQPKYVEIAERRMEPMLNQLSLI